MTDELTKTFFDTFGIEAKYESHSCDGWGRTVEVKYFTDKKEADKFGMVLSELEYPQITDRILLELICIINQSDAYLHGEEYYFEAVNYKDLKEEVIAKCKRLADKNAFSEVTGEHIKHQVQTLFKEDR